MSRFLRELMCLNVEEIAEPWALEFVRPAFDGDPDAALSLCFALSNGKRGVVAVALWLAKVPRPAFREYLASVWDHDHRCLIDAAETRRRLAAMFKYAAFPLPEALPERVRVWRGTSALTFSEARAGYSWTTNRDAACWFAMRFAERNGSPLVLAAEVTRDDIALFHDERSESEALLLRPPAGVSIDGSPDEWQQRFKRHETGIREEQRASWPGADAARKAAD